MQVGLEHTEFCKRPDLLLCQLLELFLLLLSLLLLLLLLFIIVVS